MQSYLILACGTSEATTSTIQPHELEDGESNEETRVAAFELMIELRDDPDAVELTKIGEWALDGPANGIAVHASAEGRSHSTPSLWHIQIYSRAAYASARRFILPYRTAKAGPNRWPADAGEHPRGVRVERALAAPKPIQGRLDGAQVL